VPDAEAFRMTIEPTAHHRRWRVDHSNGRWMECHVVPVPDASGGLTFETRSSFDGQVFYARRHPICREAEHEADDLLNDLLATGWVRSA
jgi:hypothetical protein